MPWVASVARLVSAVAGELDRDQDEGDDPEFAPHQLDAAPEGGADAAVLDLDHRRRQAEPDEDEDAGDEEEDEPDRDDERRRSGRSRSAGRT